MKAEFKEAYNKLSDMKPGDIAVSKDRETFFVCGWRHSANLNDNVSVILEVNQINNQYPDKRDMSQPVRILQYGDKFVCEV